MADRTSAALFGKIFTLLSKNPTEENKEIALEIYKEIFDYDFSQYQMYADEALVILGLAFKNDSSDNEDGDYRYLGYID